MASSSKGKGAIKTRSHNKHLRKDGKREHNKAVRRDGKGKSAHEEDEEVQISKFIASLSSKNYAQAHKYLTNVVNSKIQSRISSVARKPFF